MKFIRRLSLLVLLSACAHESQNTAEVKKGWLSYGSYKPSESCDLPKVEALAMRPRLVKDLLYATMGGEELRLDLYLPKSSEPSPLLMLVHGGSWRSGTKADFAKDGERFAALGYATAVVDYRLVTAGKNTAPASVQDLRCALGWLESQSTKYRFDSSRVAAVGVSAGAHLAAVLGTNFGAPEFLSGDCKNAAPKAPLKSVVAYYGPFELRRSRGLAPNAVEILTSYFGSAPEDKPELAKALSPAAQVSASSSPFFLVHGDADQTVPLLSSQYMARALARGGVPYAYFEVKGAGHGFPLFANEAGQKVATCSMLSFLHQTLAVQ